jgi:pilus assembly protein CpaC
MQAIRRISDWVPAAGLAALLAISGMAALPAGAAQVVKVSDDERVGKLQVAIGSSETIRIDLAFSEIVVGDPETADVSPLTDKTLYILGRKVGTTNVTLFDQSKQLVAVIDIEVTHDLAGLRQALKESVPGAGIRVRSVNGRVMLDGMVASAPAAQKAMAIARDFAGDQVTNSMSVAANQQVNLEVRFVEVSRTAGKELGINWNLTDNGNGFKSGTEDKKGNLTPVTGALSGVLPFGSIVANILGNGTSPDLLITALEQKKLARRLAEPNLTTLSGQSASFHAGGEVPVQTCSGTGVDRECDVTFKEFGVRLDFTPVVLDNGLINLDIRPEVSEIDASISINDNPGFVTRKARTTVELRNGQSFAIAGLLQTLNEKTADQVPWAGDLPVLGALFRSSAFRKRESDLVIIVTPRLARPVGTDQQLQTPLQNTLSSNEPEFFLLGKQEVSRKELDLKYSGIYGHIIDLPEGYNGAPSK